MDPARCEAGGFATQRLTPVLSGKVALSGVEPTAV